MSGRVIICDVIQSCIVRGYKYVIVRSNGRA
jgi:hypothetical protein